MLRLQLVKKVLLDLFDKLRQIPKLLKKFWNLFDLTGKTTLTVFFPIIFPSESFGQKRFSTVWAGASDGMLRLFLRLRSTGTAENPAMSRYTTVLGMFFAHIYQLRTQKIKGR